MSLDELYPGQAVIWLFPHHGCLQKAFAIVVALYELQVGIAVYVRGTDPMQWTPKHVWPKSLVEIDTRAIL